MPSTGVSELWFLRLGGLLLAGGGGIMMTNRCREEEVL
ncbi:LPXTG cell wall anchor domain-containing protein [Arthrobacter polaris]|nr:LPXTG cell wall anchor domain-containing protein [Arthrobacter polaris]